MVASLLRESSNALISVELNPFLGNVHATTWRSLPAPSLALEDGDRRRTTTAVYSATRGLE